MIQLVTALKSKQLVEYSIAEEIDIPILAGMHIKPTREGAKRAVNQSCAYSFYRDKVEFLVHSEKSGVIVARDADGIAGFIIATKSMRRLNKVSLTKGYLAKWLAKSILGRYGLTRDMIGKLIKIPLAFFAVFKVRTQEEEAISQVDAKILAIIVLKEKRGQGVGTELLRQACHYLRKEGIREVGVTVLPENHVAVRVYKKLGFAERGTYQESVGKSLYMTKELRVE